MLLRNGKRRLSLICAGLCISALPTVEANAQRRMAPTSLRRGTATSHAMRPSFGVPTPVQTRGRGPKRPTPTFPPIKVPGRKPRPQGVYPQRPMNIRLPGHPGTARGQAPKPTAPTSDWRKFVNGDKKPPIRDKGQTSQNMRFPSGLMGNQGTARGQAPKPTAPPSDWRKFVNGDKKPPIRDKGQTSQSNGYGNNALKIRKTRGFPRPNTGRVPGDLPVPYVHPTRDFTGFPPPKK